MSGMGQLMAENDRRLKRNVGCLLLAWAVILAAVVVLAT